MKIHHLRNATFILHLGDHRLLVDPMLADVGALPGFRMFRGTRRRNPLIPLPEGTESFLNEVTGVVLTHQHPDHLDALAIKWIKKHKLPLFVHAHDFKVLKKKGLMAQLLATNEIGLHVTPVKAKHGPGIMGWLMGKGTGWLIKGEETIYITGDTIWTPQVSQVLRESQPDVVVAPAGSANFGVGPDILFPLNELVKLAKEASGTVVFNHMEALDHCLLTRDSLRKVLQEHQLLEKCYIPEDGAQIEF